MYEFAVKYILRALLEMMRIRLTAAEFKRLMDKIFDSIEDFVEKDTALDVADEAIAGAVAYARQLLDVPDND